jgi:hypothetical protein
MARKLDYFKLRLESCKEYAPVFTASSVIDDVPEPSTDSATRSSSQSSCVSLQYPALCSALSSILEFFFHPSVYSGSEKILLRAGQVATKQE